MKKILLTLGAAALTAAASFAQVENPILPTRATFVPGPEVGFSEDPFELDGVDQTITVTFDVNPNVPVTVMYATSGGFGINMDYKRIDAVGNTVTIPLDRKTWGIPYNETYNLHLVVTFTYDIIEDGEVIPEYYLDADGNPVMFERTYFTPDTGSARLETWFPNNGMSDEYFTFAKAYENGVMYAYFSKTVEAPDDVATVTYYNLDGKAIDELPVQVAEQGWSEMYGLYQILFPIANPEYSAAQLSRIEIQINPVKWTDDDGKVVDIDSPMIVLNNTASAPQAAPRKVNKSVANGLAVGTESDNVYNLQGMLVVKNASNEDIKGLTPGMYIINGKKVAVK